MYRVCDLAMACRPDFTWPCAAADVNSERIVT